MSTQSVHLSEDLTSAVEKELQDWTANGKVRRLWARDASLWTNSDESNWLGWMATPANADRCPDGWVYALLVLDKHWRRLSRLLGRPELADDPDYATLQARLGKRQEIDQMLSDWCRSRTREEIVRVFEEEQLAAGPVLTPAETARDPHVVHREAIQQVTGKLGGSYRLAGPSAKFSRTPIRIRSGAPRVGEHSREILAEAGFSSEEIEELAADGII